jgi:hypothetical protein
MSACVRFLQQTVYDRHRKVNYNPNVVLHSHNTLYTPVYRDSMHTPGEEIVELNNFTITLKKSWTMAISLTPTERESRERDGRH